MSMMSYFRNDIMRLYGRFSIFLLLNAILLNRPFRVIFFIEWQSG